KERTEYNEELSATHKRGDEALNLEKARFEKNQVKQKDYHESEMTDLQKQQELKKQESVKNHEQIKAKNETLYNEDLGRQKQEYLEKYSRNEQHYKEALQNQRKLFHRELDAAKTENVRQLDKYAGKENDPFYSLTKVNASFDDSENAYTVSVKVPEHEIKN